MTHQPTCDECRLSMNLVRVVPGSHKVAAVECFQCECGEFSIKSGTIIEKPLVRSRARWPTFVDSPNLQPTG